jgi:hypothetical protein
MEILKSLVGYKIKVFVEGDYDEQGNYEESWFTGKLKKVDDSGVLILQEGYEGKQLNYIRHGQYLHIILDQKDQKSHGVFSAFRKEHDGLFDEE